ncbi:MAG: hypothetical protein ACP5JD_01005 [Candidatus Bipolaricaulaceae bacterium]
MSLRIGFLVLLGVAFSVPLLGASWQTAGLEFLAGTVLGYFGGILGAQIGAAVANLAGLGLVDGVLGPILFSYVGYAAGSTLGAWFGVTWTGLRLREPGDPVLGFLGASLGTGLAFLVASFTDWEWALRLGPPLAAVWAVFGFYRFALGF